MLSTITKRPCRLASHINATTEKHGDEDVSAVDIALDGIMLNANELNALMGDPHAWTALFNRSNGTLVEPMFPQIAPLSLKHKYEKATVRLVLGVSAFEVALHECKLRRIKLEPQAGGLTKLSLSVRARPDTDQISLLFAHMNHTADVEISDAEAVDDSKQRNLALGGDDDGDDPDASNDATDDATAEAVH